MSECWAKINADNVVVVVESADPDWVEAWRAANPDSEYRYVETDPQSVFYAGVGFTYEEETGRFIRPRPGPEDYWVYDEDTNNWYDPRPPEPTT